MTTQEIYTQANETTESQFSNLYNSLNENELKSYNSLVKLGDSKNLALWTVIAKRYENNEVSEMYNIAYNS